MGPVSCAWSGGWHAEEVVSPAADDARLAEPHFVVVGRCRIVSGSGAVCGNGLVLLAPDGRRFGVFFNRETLGMTVLPCR
jgi:hypothetical protein